MTHTSPASKLVLSRRCWRILALALLVAAAPAAKAEDAERDPPSRAARVVDVVGDAWLFDQDTREWTRLMRNQTVGEGDRVRTDERGRLSLRVGSTSIWVDERSDVELRQLDEGQTLLQVDRGDVALRLRSNENAAETRLRTREGTAQPEREGLYRVEQLDRGSKVYVWQGRLRFDWARSASPVVLGSGEQVELWWPDGPRAERSPLYGDGFGDWVLAQSREEGDRPVARYVSPEMTGAEDLDRHGRWETAPEYGAVWIPTVVAIDWAPYRHGRWSWARHWGWTWVDDAPWGFAPFHYGRWVSWNGRWCWAPGAYVHRPVYAPALVGWVGGSHVSVGISIGQRPPPPRFGWYPLAPREVYRPAYRHTPRYVHRVNDPRDVRDPVTVQRPHRYRDAPNAVSTLPAPGSGTQPVPVRGTDRRAEPGWGRQLPVAPGRGDLATALPPTVTRPPEADTPRRHERDRDHERDPAMGWRSDSQLPMRRDIHRTPDAPAPQPAMPALVQPQPQPAMPVQQPRQSVETPRGNGENMPWRVQGPQREERRDDRREERREERRERAPQPMPQFEAQRSAPEPQRPPAMEQPRRVEVPIRQATQEPPRMQMPQPQPQPQMQAPQRSNDGPQRSRPDAGPARGTAERRGDRQER